MSDLIDRGAVLNKLREAENHAFGSFYKGLIKAHKIIAKIPSSQLEPKMGEWKCSNDMYETAICSCCRYDTNEPWDWTKEHFMFCPSCGMKMERRTDG